MLPRGGGRLERGARVIKPGEEWGRSTDASADVECRGDDQSLAALIDAPVRRNDTTSRVEPMEPPSVAPPSPLVRFSPEGSDLARSVGLAELRAGAERAGHGSTGRTPQGSPSRGVELPIDAIASDLGVAMNCVILGVLPTRLRPYHRRRTVQVRVDGRELFSGHATTVVIANGQFVEKADLVPRGHPGDGRLEIQVYALAPGERAPMRRRLPTGSHLPHPRIIATSGRVIEVDGLRRSWPVTVDRRRTIVGSRLSLWVIPHAIRLLI